MVGKLEEVENVFHSRDGAQTTNRKTRKKERKKKNPSGSFAYVRESSDTCGFFLWFFFSSWLPAWEGRVTWLSLSIMRVHVRKTDFHSHRPPKKKKEADKSERIHSGWLSNRNFLLFFLSLAAIGTCERRAKDLFLSFWWMCLEGDNDSHFPLVRC